MRPQVAAARPARHVPPAVTAAQMAEVDRLAVDAYGITLLQMMELAGSQLAEVVRLELGGDLRGRDVVVAIGPGNNGGGGLAAARHLVNRGAGVRVVLAVPVARLSVAARHQLATLLAMDVDCCVMRYDVGDEDLRAGLDGADAIVDAVLGYGALGAPRGEAGDLLRHLSTGRAPIISLDLPSGVDPDTGETAGLALSATATLALALPKAGLRTDAGRARGGRIYVGDLGLPAALYRELAIDPGTLFAAGPLQRLEDVV